MSDEALYAERDMTADDEEDEEGEEDEEDEEDDDEHEGLDDESRA